MEKFYYVPCEGCDEMLDEARGEIEAWKEDKPYCRYCAVPDDDGVEDA